MDTKALEKLIAASLPDALILIEDLRDDGSLFRLKVASSAFENLSRLDQHRMVYAALGKFLDDNVDALTIQTFLPLK